MGNRRPFSRFSPLNAPSRGRFRAPRWFVSRAPAAVLTAFVIIEFVVFVVRESGQFGLGDHVVLDDLDDLLQTRSTTLSETLFDMILIIRQDGTVVYSSDNARLPTGFDIRSGQYAPIESLIGMNRPVFTHRLTSEGENGLALISARTTLDEASVYQSTILAISNTSSLSRSLPSAACQRSLWASWR